MALTVDALVAGPESSAIPLLRPGDYKLSAASPGFKQFIRDNVTLQAAKVAGIDIVLEVGAVTDTVEVTADAAQLQIKTESGEQSTAINNQQIQNLAVNGRNYLDLLKLTPGVVVQSSSNERSELV